MFINIIQTDTIEENFYKTLLFSFLNFQKTVLINFILFNFVFGKNICVF